MIFHSYASQIVEDVYRAIREEFRSDIPLVNGIMEQVLAIRGKGVRPLFMHQIAVLAGGSWEPVRRGAMVIEAIHIASLLHDDVVDGSELRRGTATLNSRYSDKVSVLCGDYMFMKALRLAGTLGNPETVGVVQESVTRMVEGEIADSLCTGWIDEETYLSIIRNKTASLFAAAGEMGILLTGGSGRDRERARELGECAGMAFQIVDDALDYRGDAGLMGKPTCMDAKSGCMTLPLIHALREMDSASVEVLLDGSNGSTARLLDSVRGNGGVEYALGRAEEYARRGRELLLGWPDGESRKVFDRFFVSLLDRRF